MPDHNPSFLKFPNPKLFPKSARGYRWSGSFPIVAAAAGVWIAVTKIMNEGPQITIVFSSAEGLEAGKTKIQYNGLDVGTLTTIRLAEERIT